MPVWSAELEFGLLSGFQLLSRYRGGFLWRNPARIKTMPNSSWALRKRLIISHFISVHRRFSETV